MRIGVMTTPWGDPAEVAVVARMAEERGIESIWLGEHSHLPVGTRHDFSSETPEFYRRVPDPYISLAAVAAATEVIRIGTAIALPAEHDPLTIAKTIATLDLLSHGRFEWGVGYGWNRPEMVNRGLDPRHRMSRFREVVLAVRELWTQQTAAFDGVHVRFTESWSLPKPVQQPWPPILLGCRAGQRAFSQLVEFCDGWLPSLVQAGDGLSDSFNHLTAAWRAAGRDGSPALTVIDSGFWADIDVEAFRVRTVRTATTISSLNELGADRLIVGMPLFRKTDAEPMLDIVATLVAAGGADRY